MQKKCQHDGKCKEQFQFIFLKQMIGATSCDCFIYNLVENNTLVDDWSLMIMWLMLEIERES